MKLILEVPPDFRFYQTLRDTTRQPFGLTEILKDDTYITLVDGKPLEIIHDKDSSSLRISSDHNHRPGEIRNHITELFGLTQDLENFYSSIDDALLTEKVIQPLAGLRMFQKASPFEALVAAIVDQQLNIAFAETLKTRLIKLYGRKHEIDGLVLYEFPSPDTLANQDELALRQHQFTNNKSKFIIRLAQAVVKGDIDLEEWSNQSDNELLKNLESIYGVGPWTAEYTAMVGYNRLDMLPVADIGLLNVVQKIYGLAERPTAAQVRDIAEKWKPYRGLVTFYLWYAYEQGII